MILNVYIYALYDEAESAAHSGMMADTCTPAVMEAIRSQYAAPRHIRVRRVPQLVAEEREDGSAAIRRARGGERAGCGQCRRACPVLRGSDRGARRGEEQQEGHT